MAAKKYYAWSDIVCTRQTGDKITKFEVKCGTEVTKDKLQVDEKSWNALITSKAVRDVVYPVDLNTTNPISPVTHFKKLAKAIEENSDDPSMLQSVLPPLQDEPATASAGTEVAA